MKATTGLVLLAALAALVLQGCAATGDTRADAAPAATPAPMAAASTPAAAPVSTTKIPEEDGKPVVRADTSENFQAIVAAIHQQMQPGGRWQFIDSGERKTIDGSFADMQRLYDQYGSVAKMDQKAKAQLLADQNTINVILTQKDGDRLVCETRIPVGTHFPVKTCRTYAQIQTERRETQRNLDRLNQNQRYQLRHDSH